MKPNIADDNIANILNNCIEAIRRKEKTVEECLRLHEDVRTELEPMLIAAIRLIEAGSVAPDSSRKQQARDKLLAAVEQKRWEAGVERDALISAPSMSRPRIFALGRRLSIITLIFLMLTGGTMAMAKESLPGSPFYPLKLAMEKARISLARDDSTKSKLYLNAAEERMHELKRLKGENPHYSELVKAIATNIELAEEASENQTRQEFSAEIGKLVKKNQKVLEDTLDKVPPSAKPALQRALANVKSDAESGEDENEKTGNGVAGRSREKDHAEKSSTTTSAPVKKSDAKADDTEHQKFTDRNPAATVVDSGSSKQQPQNSDRDKSQDERASEDNKKSGNSDENASSSYEIDRDKDALKDHKD